MNRPNILGSRISDDDKLRICEMYRRGMKLKEISCLYGLSTSPIIRVLRDGGVDARRTGARDSTVRHWIFDKMSPSVEYWMGFIAGDGCVLDNQDGNPSAINIGSIDIDILRKFRDFVGSTSVISKNKTHYAFVFTSTNACMRLIENGITQRKSKTLCVSGHLALSRDFWRGVIDADGCIHIRRKRRPSDIYLILATGSIAFARQYQDYILSIAPGKSSIHTISSGEFRNYQVSAGGNRAVMIIRNLYSSSSANTVLDRKMAKALDAIDIVESKNK